MIGLLGATSSVRVRSHLKAFQNDESAFDEPTAYEIFQRCDTKKMESGKEFEGADKKLHFEEASQCIKLWYEEYVHKNWAYKDKKGAMHSEEVRNDEELYEWA